MSTPITPPPAHVLDNAPRTLMLHLLLDAGARSTSVAIDAGLTVAAAGLIYHVHTTQAPHSAWVWGCVLGLVVLVAASGARALTRALERTASSRRWWGLMRTVEHPATGPAAVVDTDEREGLAGRPWVLIQPLHTGEGSAVWAPVGQLSKAGAETTKED